MEEKTEYKAGTHNFIQVMPCLVCGEGVRAEWYSKMPKICDKCKQAVLHVRKELEKEDRNV